MPTPSELAEDTLVHLLPQPGIEVIDRGDLVFNWTGNGANVQRVRLGDVAEAVAWARQVAHERAARRVEWWIGWNATPAGIVEQLLELGLVPDDEEATLTGMTLEQAPPAAPGVDVRKLETIDEVIQGMKVDWEVWGYDAVERESRAETERRRFAPGPPVHHFAAFVDGSPVGFGRAVDMESGVALLGGAVLPSHRGRGIYRALVRARWDHAASRGTPLLVVQAGRMSEPVLRGLGFQTHGVMRLLMDPQVGSGTGPTPPARL